MTTRSKIKTTDWLSAHVGHEGDECLIWPFSRDPANGYCRLNIDRKSFWAHRVMCERAHGAPPTPKHYAAHSCGCGHLGCVNPRHLSWKTPQENSRDMVAHGRARPKGPPRFKLRPEQVEEIRRLKGTMTQAAIAEMFGIDYQQIGKIHRGQAWTDSPRPNGRRFPPERRAEMCRIAATMRAGGATFEEIATHLSVCRVTARYLSEDGAAALST